MSPWLCAPSSAHWAHLLHSCQMTQKISLWLRPTRNHQQRRLLPPLTQMTTIRRPSHPRQTTISRNELPRTCRRGLKNLKSPSGWWSKLLEKKRKCFLRQSLTFPNFSTATRTPTLAVLCGTGKTAKILSMSTSQMAGARMIYTWQGRLSPGWSFAYLKQLQAMVVRGYHWWRRFMMICKTR